MFNDFDFIGFTYNGKHSYNDFGIYRVIDGDRYNEDLVPQMNDKTADVPGGDGQYFFGTNYKSRQFNINIAFDGLTEEQFREMRHWLDGKDIHDLIFDERPYKVYSAKVSSTPQLKYVAFSENGKRIYKGEGTIQFTCYYPFAHTPRLMGDSEVVEKVINANEVIPVNLYFKEWYKIFVQVGERKRTGIKILYREKIDNKLIDREIEKSTSSYFNIFNSENPIFIKELIIENQSNYVSFIIKDQSDTELFSYIYTDNNCFERTDGEKDGKSINDFSSYANMSEWMEASNLPTVPIVGHNYGELPAPFIVSIDSFGGDSSEDKRELQVGNNIIYIDKKYQRIKWDSKTGLVYGSESSDGELKLIPYTGTSYGALSVGENTISDNIKDYGTLTYDYWYY